MWITAGNPRITVCLGEQCQVFPSWWQCIGWMLTGYPQAPECPRRGDPAPDPVITPLPASGSSWSVFTQLGGPARGGAGGGGGKTGGAGAPNWLNRACQACNETPFRYSRPRWHFSLTRIGIAGAAVAPCGLTVAADGRSIAAASAASELGA